MSGASLRVALEDETQVGQARRAATALAVETGFGEELAGRVALVVAEAASNVVKHAHRGEVLLRPVHARGVGGIEVLALDRGPGIADLAAALRDGHSTAGTSGNGLGAVRRLATVFDIQSGPLGTAVLAQVWSRARPDEPLEVGAVCVAMSGEEACGDGWDCVVDDGRARVLVVDGLGHGIHAATAAREATRLFQIAGDVPPELAMRALHAGLGHTRGAAAGVAEVTCDGVQYAGIGNVACVVLDAASGKPHGLPSTNGIAGHGQASPQSFARRWTPGSVLLLHSDGVRSRWSLEAYPGLTAARHPTLIAAVLYRDFARGNDDVAVLVVKDHRAVVKDHRV